MVSLAPLIALIQALGLCDGQSGKSVKYVQVNDHTEQDHISRKCMHFMLVIDSTQLFWASITVSGGSVINGVYPV